MAVLSKILGRTVYDDIVATEFFPVPKDEISTLHDLYRFFAEKTIIEYGDGCDLSKSTNPLPGNFHGIEYHAPTILCEEHGTSRHYMEHMRWDTMHGRDDNGYSQWHQRNVVEGTQDVLRIEFRLPTFIPSIPDDIDPTAAVDELEEHLINAGYGHVKLEETPLKKVSLRQVQDHPRGWHPLLQPAATRYDWIGTHDEALSTDLAFLERVIEDPLENERCWLCREIAADQCLRMESNRVMRKRIAREKKAEEIAADERLARELQAEENGLRRRTTRR